MNKLFVVLCCALFLATPVTVVADALKVGQSDNVMTMLEAQKGKRVSVKLASGAELTGTVRAVNKNIVQLGALSGKEYFDAVVNMNDIEAVVVRVK